MLVFSVLSVNILTNLRRAFEILFQISVTQICFNLNQDTTHCDQSIAAVLQYTIFFLSVSVH